MTEDEALKKARDAMKQATDKFGADRDAVMREIDRKKDQDPLLEQAFGIAGRVFQQAEQNIKH
ncbi:hypothetical protein [Pandoraea sputorum]|uniref:Uncharacterized protein n=1 Tax=Pandoraea sputorum TaxID=93222 RepID=A0A5E5BC70_9BURK|nr:hypothetical protein [Pandoraea sputorum]VVE82888.1 hypothetical protein PSP31121_04018 [Pandoraea sputorum]